MAFLAGKSGKVTAAGGATVNVKSWKAKFVKDELDTTNTGSSGKREFQAGLQHIEFTIEAEWDASVNPFSATPFNVDSVDTLAISLFTDGAGTANLIMPTAFVSSVDIDAPVDGIIKYTITGKSSGSYTING